MEKLNIANLLKDCPTGMELDCTIWDNIVFEEIDRDTIVIFRKSVGAKVYLTQYGEYNSIDGKCVIFPKGKTTWEGFQRPFKDGDVVFYDGMIAIFKGWGDETLFRTHCVSYTIVNSPISQFEISRPLFGKGIRRAARFATEEEKQKLFDAIKANGYKWNAETKTLEKLIEPKFKVGDRIVKRNSIGNSWIISSVSSEYYGLQLPKGSENIGVLPVCKQDDWELAPNKFNIADLKPFDKVLVRDNNEQKWTVDMFSFYDKNLIYPFNCIGHYINQCIPYENNEYLLGTNNDCKEFYKTWE